MIVIVWIHGFQVGKQSGFDVDGPGEVVSKSSSCQVFRVDPSRVGATDGTFGVAPWRVAHVGDRSSFIVRYACNRPFMTIVQEVAQAIQLVTSKGLPFSIVCHSMGGLVSVQAVSYGLRTIAKFQAPEQILAFDTPWAGIKPEFKDLLASPDVASNLAILIGKAPSLVTAALTQQYVMTLAPKHEPAVSLGYQAAGWLAGQFVGRIVAESRATETFVDIVKPLVSLLMSGVQVRHYNFLEPVIIPAGAAEQMSQEMQYLISMNVRIELISCSRPVCFAAFEPPPGVNTSVWDQPLAQFPPWALVVFGGSLEGRDLGFSLMHVIHHIGMFDTEDFVQRACAKLV